MASLRVLAFDHEGCPLLFDTWLDDLLLNDSRDSVSLFDHTSGAAPAPPATADSATRSQWLTCVAAARLAIRNHLPLTECNHFGQHRTAQALYDAVDLVSHLRTSDARYHSAAPPEFLDRNQPQMYTLYFIVTRLPDSLRSVMDHFLSLDPTVLTIDLLEQHLLAAETSVVAIGAARGTPRTPFFEGCSPSPLAPSYASVATVDIPSAEDVGAASASAKRRSTVEVVEAVEVVAAMSGGGSGGFGGGGGGSGGSGGSGSGGSGGGRTGAQCGGSGGGQRERQQRWSETRSPQQLHEWLFKRGASAGSVSCPYVIRTGDRADQTCGKPHTQHRCFFRLDDAWRAEFGDEVERPHWAELLRSGVAIFDLDYDAILSAMYALSGASESSLPDTAPAEALQTFTLDSGASRCFFRDSTTLTPLPAPVPVRLADPSRGPVVAHSSTLLPCPVVPSGSLSGLHLPSFSTNLVSTAALQDSMVTTTTPGGQRVSICTCTRTGRHLATFTRRPGSSLYTLATEPPKVAASAQVSASGQVAPPCSCRLLSHHTLLWHRCLGHPSLPRMRGMHSPLLVCGLPRSLPPLPPSPAPPCLPCVEGRQRAAPHSSFPPTTAPLQTLRMDVWGPARVSGQGRERYCLLVVDNYTWYTTVFTLRTKGQVVDVLIPWIRAVRLQLREQFHQDLPVLCLHSDSGGEFSSDLLRDRHIGLVMEVARISMIHVASPHFLRPFAVRYTAHQLNLWPRVSLLETSPTLRWIGEVGDATVFPVRGSRAFVRDTSADKLSARAIPSVILGFPPDAPGWQFYHPTSRRVFPSQDVTFDESIPFYRLFPYHSAPPPPPPLFLAPGSPLVDTLSPQGPAPSGVSQVDPLPGTVPVESDGAGSGGAEPGGAEPGGAEPEGVEPGRAESMGAESGGAESRGAASSGGPTGALPRLSPRPEPLSPQQLREWLVRRARLWSGAAGAGATGDTGAGGAGVATASGPGGARTRGTGFGGPGAGGAGAGGTGAGGVGAGGAGAVDPGAGGAGAGGASGTGVGGTVRPRPYFIPLIQQVLGVPSSTSLTPPLLCLLPDQLQLPLQPASPLPAPSPYTEQFGRLTERHEPASRPFSPIRTACRVPRSRPPLVPGTHSMALRTSSVPLRVPLPPHPESSLPAIPNPEFDLSTAASALVVELLDFAAACRLDYATALVSDSESATPPSVEDIPSPRSYAEAITGPYSSQWQAAMDAEMASWKSTGTYVDAVPPSLANIVDGMWIFRVKRPPSSPPALKARYVARGFSQRQEVHYFQTFSPTPKMTTLWVLLHIAAQRDYELHSHDFNTCFLQGSLHEEMWLRRPSGFTGSFPASTQWSLSECICCLACSGPGGAEPGGAVLGGAVLGGAEPRGAEPGGAGPGGAEPGCAAPGGAELQGAPPGFSPGASSLRETLSLQELREWFARRWRRAAGAGGSLATEGAAVAGPGGARTVRTGAAEPASSTGAGAAEGVGTETTAGGPARGTPGAAGGSGAAGGATGEGAPAGGTGAVPAVSGVAARPRPSFVPLLEQPTSPLPAPSPYTGPTGGLAERREPASRPA
ncbi:unnamed protein product [Closterium sp. NIES-53]